MWKRKLLTTWDMSFSELGLCFNVLFFCFIYNLIYFMQIFLFLGAQNSLFWFLSLNDSFLYLHWWTQKLEKILKTWDQERVIQLKNIYEFSPSQQVIFLEDFFRQNQWKASVATWVTFNYCSCRKWHCMWQSPVQALLLPWKLAITLITSSSLVFTIIICIIKLSQLKYSVELGTGKNLEHQTQTKIINNWSTY